MSIEEHKKRFYELEFKLNSLNRKVDVIFEEIDIIEQQLKIAYSSIVDEFEKLQLKYGKKK